MIAQRHCVLHQPTGRSRYILFHTLVPLSTLLLAIPRARIDDIEEI
jgi:hypothetical protein